MRDITALPGVNRVIGGIGRGDEKGIGSFNNPQRDSIEIVFINYFSRVPGTFILLLKRPLQCARLDIFRAITETLADLKTKTIIE
jgi:hypothetical protein